MEATKLGGFGGGGTDGGFEGTSGGLDWLGFGRGGGGGDEIGPGKGGRAGGLGITDVSIVHIIITELFWCISSWFSVYCLEKKSFGE